MINLQNQSPKNKQPQNNDKMTIMNTVDTNESINYDYEISYNN